MSSRYDNDSEDVVQENKKQTEAINKYIIGTLKMYIDPEIFLKNTSGNTKKRKFPSVYYTRRYTETPSEVQKTQKAITNEQAVNKLPSGSGASGASGTSGITAGIGAGTGQQPPLQQFQQQMQQQQPMQLQQQQQQQQLLQMQRPPMQQQIQQQLVRRPTEVMGGGAEPMYGMGSMGMGGVSGLNIQATSISSRVDPNAEPYIASLIKFSNAGFPPYSTIKSQVDTFFNLRAFRGFLKKLGNPITIRGSNNQAIDVEKALGPTSVKDSDGKSKKVEMTQEEIEFRNVFGQTSSVFRDDTSVSGIKSAYTNPNGKGATISFWSTNAVPQKIGKAFIFLYTIPTPQESRQQAQLSGSGRNLNANKPMMLMVKDGSEYSLIGGYIDNTIKTIIGNTQVSSENETEVTKPDVIFRTITKEFSSKTGMSNVPSSIASKYLLYKSGDNYDTKLEKIKKEIDEKNISRQSATNDKSDINKERIHIQNNIERQQTRKTLIDKNDVNYSEQIGLIDEKILELQDKSDQKNSAMGVEQKKIEDYTLQIKKLEREMEDVNKDKEILPVVVYAVQVSQNAMQTIIQNSKSRTTLASGELVMVPIVTIYNVLGGKQITDNISISTFQNKLLQLTIGILQNEKIISQIADASQIGNDYYGNNDTKRMEELQKFLSPDSISEIDDIVKHNIKFMLGIFFSYKNSFSYSGIQYIINSVDWGDSFKQLRERSKLLKRMNASYYIDLKLFLEKLEPGKLPSDRKGTFLESCGVKGAIIRNEWKNNFESLTLKEWKALLPLPTFGKGEGEGIFNKLVPSFIKNAIKSIKNPLMSPLDPGVLQVSLIQYSLLGEVELQEFYSNIENSFAGVAWKNDNTWDKRKQRLFSAMDECQADIYCFQNVQCSLDVYKTCVDEAVSDGDVDEDTKQTRLKILRDINKLSTYRERLILYFGKIHEKLISTHDAEGLNCVSDIYEKYKDSYDFVYFFEQVFYTSDDFRKNPNLSSLDSPNRLYPEYGKPVALGNLTMVKKGKFEIENKLRYDVRIGATFCSEKNKAKFNKYFSDCNPTSTTFDSFRDEYESICRNKSFASMIYIRFKPVSEVSTPVVLSTLPSDDEVEYAMNNEETSFESDETLQEVINSNEDEEAVEDEENVEDENTGGNEKNVGRNESSTRVQGGGAPSWYDKDTTEVAGYGRLINKPKPPSSSKKKSRKSSPPPPPLPCFDMKDTLYIPSSQVSSKQLFGICNIKFDTTDISQKQKAGTINLPKDVMQVVLMALFIYKLRFNMQSYGLRITNLHDYPFIISGLFRDDMVTGSDSKPILNSALKLLTTDKTNKWRKNIDIFGKDGGPLDMFVRHMSILTYLRVGKIRVAGFHPIHRNFNPKLIGDFYPLEDSSGSKKSISELIICCDNFKICNTDPGSDNAMYKMIPAVNPNPKFPLFPNNVNPSNSVAIGGVFDITPPAILSHISIVTEQIKEGRDADKQAVIKAQNAAVRYENEKMNLSDLQKMFPPALSSSAASSASGSASSASGFGSGSGFGSSSGSGSGAPAAAPAPTPAPAVSLVTSDKLIASSNAQPENNGPYISPPFIFKPDTMIGDQAGGDIDSTIKVCTNGVAYDIYLTKSDVTEWTPISTNIYSDHAPIRYEYTIDDNTGVVTCSTSGMSAGDTTGKRSIRFVTWNIAYQMKHNGTYYSSKFYCSKATTDPCKEEDNVYKQRLTNILTAVDTIMQKDNVDYVLLQECECQDTTSQTAIQKIADGITRFTGKYDVLNFSYTPPSPPAPSAESDTTAPPAPPAPKVQKNTEFCLIVKKPTPPTPSDIKEFNFRQDTSTNDYPSPMSQYVAKKFSSYSTTNKSALPYVSINGIDINSVMCYVIPSTKTIFFNVHFKFGNPLPLIWQRQKEIYDFMNAIVDIIRSIPSTDIQLYPYHNYDIVFSGDFNVNMLQRFPKDVTYPDGKPMEPYFFKCVKIPDQKTIISTTKSNFPSAFAKESDTNNYNTTNIDFSILYPALVSVAPPLSPTPVPGPSPASVISSNSFDKYKVMVKHGNPKDAVIARMKEAGFIKTDIDAFLNQLKSSGAKTPYTAPATDTSPSTSTASVNFIDVHAGEDSPTSASAAPVAPAPAPIVSTLASSTATPFLKVMSFNTWFAAFDPKKHTETDDTSYCAKNGTNLCKKYIMDEIMRQIEQGTQVIFLQEFVQTDQIKNTFTGYPVSFTDTSQHPFVMTYTPKPPSLSQPDEYYVYSFKAGGASGNGETAATLCSKRFFSSPPSDYFMGNLTSIPNTPLFATIGDTTQPKDWIASGGSRPYIVLVFKDKKMILINIHAPHGVGRHGDIQFKKQPDSSSQHKIEVDKQNAKYKNIMEYAITELGIMLRKRIATELKDYSIVFGGDFNCGPDRAQEYLAMLGKKGEEGVFSNSSGQFKTFTTKPLPSPFHKEPTCCVTNSTSKGFTSAFDQIYSNKLNIVDYRTYNQSELQKPDPLGKLNYFSDHLPVYAEIQVPAPASMPILSPPVTATAAATSEAKSKVAVIELSIEGIKTNIKNSNSSSIYIINGGSFNPPHFGHIKMFELAYQAIKDDLGIPKEPNQRYYGVMVLSDTSHISKKLPPGKLKDTGVLTLEQRIRLCALTINDYPWSNPLLFGPQNMIIISKDEGNPMGAIMKPFRPNQQIFDRLYYLCGSDFYFNTETPYWKSDYNMIYNIRKKVLLGKPDPYKGTRRRLKTTDFEKEISSTKIREDILKMETKFDSDVANEIKDTIGIGSYCYLGDIDYLKIPKPNYGLKQMGCPGQAGGGSDGGQKNTNTNTSKRTTLKNNKLKSRKIKKLVSTSISTPTTRFTKKKHHSNHSNNKKRKTRRSKH